MTSPSRQPVRHASQPSPPPHVTLLLPAPSPQKGEGPSSHPGKPLSSPEKVEAATSLLEKLRADNTALSAQLQVTIAGADAVYVNCVANPLLLSLLMCSMHPNLAVALGYVGFFLGQNLSCQ